MLDYYCWWFFVIRPLGRMSICCWTSRNCFVCAVLCCCLFCFETFRRPAAASRRRLIYTLGSAPFDIQWRSRYYYTTSPKMAESLSHPCCLYIAWLSPVVVSWREWASTAVNNGSYIQSVRRSLRATHRRRRGIKQTRGGRKNKHAVTLHVSCCVLFVYSLWTRETKGRIIIYLMRF